MQTQSPSTAAHEERLAQYARQLEVFDGSTDRFDAGFICIDPSHLTANARCEAATWLVRSCGAMVGDSDRAAMQVGPGWGRLIHAVQCCSQIIISHAWQWLLLG